MYLNTQSSSYTSCGYVYKCTATNTWVYQGVIKGPQGNTGSTGSTGRSAKWVAGTEVTGTSTDPTSQSTASCYQYDWYLNSDTYNIYSSNTGTDKWVYEGNLSGTLPTLFQRLNSNTYNPTYWRKVAAISFTGANKNRSATFLFHEAYGTASHKPQVGILHVNCRTGSTSGQGAANNSFAQWLIASSSITIGNFALLYYNNQDIDGDSVSGSIRYELWVKGRSEYATYQISIIDAVAGDAKDIKSEWVLYTSTATSSSVGQASLPTDCSGSSTSVKMDIL